MAIDDIKVNKKYIKNALNSSPFEVNNQIMKTDSGKIAWLRTMYVLAITLVVYIPLAIICVILFAIYNYKALPLWLLVVLSAFPFAKYVVIHLSKIKLKNIV